MKLTWLAGAFAGVVAFTAPTAAQEITLAYGSAVTSIDPLFHNLSSNINFSLNLFDRLVEQDAHQRPVPGLAASWKAIDDTVWEFKLRSGVRFHDGSIFGPEDVAASLKRVAWMPNSPSPFTIYTRAITQTIIVDPTTIRFRTAAPYPLMPVDISSIHIIERQYEQAPTVDFNSGRAAIGTGPYKFVSYTAGDRLVLARNDDYWGANYGARSRRGRRRRCASFPTTCRASRRCSRAMCRGSITSRRPTWRGWQRTKMSAWCGRCPIPLCSFTSTSSASRRRM